MNEKTFWKPAPRKPWQDWRMHTMLYPIIISAFGFLMVGVFAYAMKDIRVIAPDVQSWLIVIGGGLIVAGAELNTPFATIECFRKIRLNEHDWLDITALVASLVGTAVNVLLALALRINTTAGWQGFVANYGPLLSVVAVALDYYGATVELAGLFSSFDVRYPLWLEEKQKYESTMSTVDLQKSRDKLQEQLAQLQEKVERLQWKPATIDDARQVLAGRNGKFPANEQGLAHLEQALAEIKRKLPDNDRTPMTWLSRHSKGEL